MIITIDPGHGGHDSGALGSYSIEKELTLSIGLHLGALMLLRGNQIHMTRYKDEFLSLEQRAHLANEAQSDLFVSIHCNAHESDAEGIETFYYSERGKIIAESVQDSLIRTFPDNKDRGAKKEVFYVLRHTKMPAILVECEFITSKEHFLNANKKLIAEAIMRGIL